MMRADLTGAEGPKLRLRLICSDDADYVFRLRTDPLYCPHLSPVTGDVAAQRRWIEAYREREAQGAEFYYVIERRDDGSPCGLVRLYNIAGDSFEWGSWILDGNKPTKAALESAVLSFRCGFRGLGAKLALIEVRKGNTHALAFYRRFGMAETSDDADNIYLQYTRARFEQDEPEFGRLIGEGQLA